MYKKRFIFWAACAGMFLFGICLITLGSVAPELREKLHLDALGAGALFSILPLGILTGSLVFGPIADKYGSRILLSVSSFLMFAGLEGIAFSNSAGWLKIFIFLFGLGGGAINGATNALVADISDRDKGANLSLLGVAFGFGALGMPLIYGILKNLINFETIVSSVGILSLVIGTAYLFTGFPPPKQRQGFPIAKGMMLFRDPVLILIALFLFFQSGIEGIINNWTTTFLMEQNAFQADKALFALSAFVAGMTIMRLLNGSLLKSLPEKKLLAYSFAMVFAGLIIWKTGTSFPVAVTGLAMTGAGLASGFPVMLGFVGSRYPEISGTAFSIVLFIALLGNTLINLAMGFVARYYGIAHLFTFALAETFIMMIICFIILKMIRNNNI